MKEKIMFGIFAIGVFMFCYFYLDYIIKKKLECKKGEKHEWVFRCNSKGITGDLGFGIKNPWNINHYSCGKCGKSKEDEIY
jgi:hypothetical protein